jgi:dTMP kinase
MFITLEGIDGAGKSSQIPFIAQCLEKKLAGRHALLQTREPGGTALGEQLRPLLLNMPMHPETEALLMFAARKEHLATVIEPALARGDWVLCDRFTDASYAYQGGGRGVAVTQLSLLEQFTHPRRQPDLTFLFDLPPHIAAARRSQARQADKFEAEAEAFHERTRAAYLARAAQFPSRFCLIDASLAMDNIKKMLEEIIVSL